MSGGVSVRLVNEQLGVDSSRDEKGGGLKSMGAYEKLLFGPETTLD